MKGASKVIMGATVVMVVSLAIVLGLVLVLLAELYCTLLLRRRQLRMASSDTPITTASSPTPATTTITSPTTHTSSSHPLQHQNHSPSSPSPPFSSFYAPGVLQAPRSFLFPAVPCKETKKSKQHSQFHHVLELYSRESSNTSPQPIGLVRTPPPLASYLSSPQEIREIPIQVSPDGKEKSCPPGGGGGDDHFIYISNPIYDNENRPSRIDTPFETPDSSPSRLATGDLTSSDEEIAQASPSSSSPKSLPVTPPLTPMKKLPAEASSLSLRDARSLGTSGSDSVSNNGVSSSSSGSPCTSPSW